MRAAGRDVLHHLRDGGSAVLGQAAEVAADQEVRAQILRQAEQLVDVALAVADVDTALRLADQLGRASEIVGPANALLLIDRPARRVELSLQCCPVPLNLSRDPTFTAVRSRGGPSGVTARLAGINSPQMVCW